METPGESFYDGFKTVLPVHEWNSINKLSLKLSLEDSDRDSIIKLIDFLQKFEIPFGELSPGASTWLLWNSFIAANSSSIQDDPRGKSLNLRDPLEEICKSFECMGIFSLPYTAKVSHWTLANCEIRAEISIEVPHQQTKLGFYPPNRFFLTIKHWFFSCSPSHIVLLFFAPQIPCHKDRFIKFRFIGSVRMLSWMGELLLDFGLCFGEFSTGREYCSHSKNPGKAIIPWNFLLKPHSSTTTSITVRKLINLSPFISIYFLAILQISLPTPLSGLEKNAG